MPSAPNIRSRSLHAYGMQDPASIFFCALLRRTPSSSVARLLESEREKKKLWSYRQ